MKIVEVNNDIDSNSNKIEVKRVRINKQNIKCHCTIVKIASGSAYSIKKKYSNKIHKYTNNGYRLT